MKAEACAVLHFTLQSPSHYRALASIMASGLFLMLDTQPADV